MSYENEIHKACAAGDAGTLLRLFSTSNPKHFQKVIEEVNKVDESGSYPMMLAAKGGHAAVIELLCEYGACVDGGLDNSPSPLLEASWRGHAQAVEVLLKKGASIEGRKNGTLPLYAALVYRHTKVVDLLLENGADANSTTPFGHSLLLQACKKGPVEIPRLLLLHGADPNARTRDDSAPIHFACARGDFRQVKELIETLLDFGADVNATAKDGTPLHMAFAQNNLELIGILVKNGADVTLVAQDSYRDNIPILKKLYECGCQVPLLAAAAKRQEYERMKTYVESKAVDLNVEDARGISALQYMFDESNLEMAEFLLLNGARAPKVRNPRDPTPLHNMAKYDPGKGEAETGLQLGIAVLLVLNGADINAVWKTRSTELHVATHITPLHVAIQSGFMRLVLFLVDYGATYEHTVYKHINADVLMSIWQMCEANKEFEKIFGKKWTPANHKRHPTCIRHAVVCVLLTNKRQRWGLDSSILCKIFEMLAYDWTPCNDNQPLILSLPLSGAML